MSDDLYGFHSLQLTSACRAGPLTRIGMESRSARRRPLGCWRLSAIPTRRTLALLGVGESSDGTTSRHRIRKDPGRAAMQAALEDAGLAAAAVDYINLHGTGTPSNDGAESNAVEALFGTGVPCSSTKGASGHALGAAGALEIAISAIAITDGFMPGRHQLRPCSILPAVSITCGPIAARGRAWY